jgi:hypothetical protein
MRSTSPALTFTVNTGMVSRVFYDEKGRITGHEVLDKFGQKINIPHGEFPSLEPISSSADFGKNESDSNPLIFFRDRLPQWRFPEFEAALKEMTKNFPLIEAV